MTELKLNDGAQRERGGVKKRTGAVLGVLFKEKGFGNLSSAQLALLTEGSRLRDGEFERLDGGGCLMFPNPFVAALDTASFLAQSFDIRTRTE